MAETKLDDFYKGRLEAYCYMVERGVRPAAMTEIQTRKVEAAKAFLDSQNIKYLIEEVEEDKNWSVVWIYKYDHVLKVIKSLPQASETVFDHWALGKLFGYSDEQIELHTNKVGSVALGTRR